MRRSKESKNRKFKESERSVKFERVYLRRWFQDEVSWRENVRRWSEADSRLHFALSVFDRVAWNQEPGRRTRLAILHFRRSNFATNAHDTKWKELIVFIEDEIWYSRSNSHIDTHPLRQANRHLYCTGLYRTIERPPYTLYFDRSLDWARAERKKQSSREMWDDKVPYFMPVRLS